MSDLFLPPAKITSYQSYRGMIKEKPKVLNQKFYYFCIDNSVNYRVELKSQLISKLEKNLAKKIAKKLKKPISQLDRTCKSLSGIIKLSVKNNEYEMFHYFLRLRKKAKEKIELFLVKITEEFNVVKAMKKLFIKNQNNYRKKLKKILGRSEMTYLKCIGKGKIDYDIERKLGYSRVELVDIKNLMVSKLELRNDRELYWVAQRAGYCIY